MKVLMNSAEVGGYLELFWWLKALIPASSYGVLVIERYRHTAIVGHIDWFKNEQAEAGKRTSETHVSCQNVID